MEKKNNIALYLVIGIALALLGLVVGIYIGKNSNNTIENNDNNKPKEEVKKLDDSKDYAYYEYTKELGTISLDKIDENVNILNYEKIESNKWSIKNKYVVINLNSEDASKVNKKFKDEAEKLDYSENNGPLVINEITTDRIYMYNPIIVDSSKYISVLRFRNGSSVYMSSYASFYDVIVINKETGKIVEQKDLIPEDIKKLLDDSKEKAYKMSLYDDGINSSIINGIPVKDGNELYTAELEKINDGKYAIFVNKNNEIQLTIYGLTSQEEYLNESGSIDYIYKDNQLEPIAVRKP